MINVFAIGDLHLSGNPPQKPMHVFGENWVNHWDNIVADWCNVVREGDVVLIPGDISWAMSFEEAAEDLQAIAGLPGKKILVKGNHDYWWQSAAKMREKLPSSITFIHNSYSAVGDIAICGSRGWINPSDESFTEQDRKIYEREIGRIAASIKAARQDGYVRFILVTHYPMFYASFMNDEWRNLFVQQGIQDYVFGHLHGQGIEQGPSGDYCGVCCHLVSCDALDFKLKKITAVEE